MRHCRMTRVGFLVGKGSVIGRDDSVLRSALGLCRAGEGLYGRRHGAARPGQAGN